MKKLTFFVNGMHCKACVMLTESQIKDYPGVVKAKSDLSQRIVEVEGDFGDKTSEQIAFELTKLLKTHGYSLSTTREDNPKRWRDFVPAGVGAVVFITLFSVVQRLGFLDVVYFEKINFASAFLIGIVASVSTCMVVVGSLVVSLSSNIAREGGNRLPHMLFHLSRLISFFVLGGLIGVLGLRFQPDINSTIVLNIVVSIVLLIMGINLLEIFDWAKGFQVTMPSFLGEKMIRKIKNINRISMPFLLGIASFFLPCGFTQSMQIYTLTSGGFLNGALIMLSFALGTLPVLLLLSFGPIQIISSAKSKIFFRGVGLVIIYFAITSLFNILRTFVF